MIVLKLLDFNDLMFKVNYSNCTVLYSQVNNMNYMFCLKNYLPFFVKVEMRSKVTKK